MKNLFIILLVLMSLVSFSSWGETMNDLVQREGTYYKKFSDVPFTGKVEGRDQGNIKNGKLEGPWISYYSNGQQLAKGNFKNGKSDGLWLSYHDNGQLGAKGNVKKGEYEGYWVWYNKSASLIVSLTGTYRNGVKVSN